MLCRQLFNAATSSDLNLLQKDADPYRQRARRTRFVILLEGALEIHVRIPLLQNQNQKPRRLQADHLRDFSRPVDGDRKSPGAHVAENHCAFVSQLTSHLTKADAGITLHINGVRKDASSPGVLIRIV
jgi:hypothetical protein